MKMYVYLHLYCRCTCSRAWSQKRIIRLWGGGRGGRVSSVNNACLVPRCVLHTPTREHLHHSASGEISLSTELIIAPFGYIGKMPPPTKKDIYYMLYAHSLSIISVTVLFFIKNFNPPCTCISTSSYM